MTNMNSSAAPSSQTRTTRRKRRPVLAFGLAVLAVGGIGAAATSAAWTDNTFFSAPAAAATFDIQGSIDGTTWLDSGTKDSVQLTIPAETLANLLPGQSRTVKLWVRNQSSVSAALTSEVAFATGSTFVVNPGAAVSGLAATLTPSGSGATDQFDLTVTAPADWAPANQGKTGTIVVTVAATATA
ncbi:hypothetical protein [Microbacterium sp. NPDC058345]|uniref:hypothetical protein n=1 Tax=Microbacterium sp. NPDC058345 TaxID=3346455 RepID=UPI003654A5E6